MGKSKLDKQGRFVIEWLPPGDYEVTVSGYPGSLKKLLESMKPEGKLPTRLSISRVLTVPGDAEVEVTLVLDLKKPEDKR